MAKPLDAFLDAVLSAPLFQDRESPLHKRVAVLDDRASSKLTLVCGNNSSGKSVFRRLVQEECQEEEIVCLDVSMELRSQEPYLRAEVYGDEEAMSTGIISVSSMMRLLRVSQEHPRNHVVFWDEPDVGLSDEVATGMALDVLDFIDKSSEKLIGMFIVTHRRSLLEYLKPAKPRAIFMGPASTKPTSLDAWLSRKIVPRRPASIVEEGVELWKAIDAYQAGQKEKRR